MADYSAKQATAARMILEKGLAVRIVHKEQDEDALPVPGGGYVWNVTTTDTYAVKTQPNKEEVQNGVFNGTDMILLVAGMSKAPRVTDTVTFQGTMYDIIAVRTVAPAEQDILYKVQIKEHGVVDGD